METDLERVERIAATIEKAIELLREYAGRLEAELGGFGSTPEEARLASIVRGQFSEVRACLRRVEGDAFEHVLRMRDRGYLLPKARAGKLL